MSIIEIYFTAFTILVSDLSQMRILKSGVIPDMGKTMGSSVESHDHMVDVIFR